MKDIVPNISPLIESQFPSFYKEDGQTFITFVKTYYEWLEQANNAIYHSRRLLEYRDVDQTVESFLVYFKEETLKNIQFDIATNKRLFIKNALDFYRSKGTERSIDLFFKLVYAQPASVRYPSDDIFKLSDISDLIGILSFSSFILSTSAIWNSKFRSNSFSRCYSVFKDFSELQDP